MIDLSEDPDFDGEEYLREKVFGIKSRKNTGNAPNLDFLNESRESREEREERRRKRDEEIRLKNTLRRTNKEIMLCTYIFILIFIGVIGYMGYFMHYQADSFRNNSYNSRRQALLEESCIRGQLQARDGSVLAQTIVDEGDDSEFRDYPYGRMFAHVVGYSNVGTAGLESQAGSSLLESHEFLPNRILRNLRGKKDVGDTVRTTLDVHLQEAAYDALGDHRGAIVVMDPTTGAILAMVSKPDYNPNSLPQYYEDIINSDDDNGTLVNRASQGLYPPGSTFKVLTTLEYLREHPKKAKNFTFDCEGLYTEEDYTIQCYGRTEHGELDLDTAFAKSCNGAFAQIGRSLNFADFYNMCTEFGFNQTISGVSMAGSVFKLKSGESAFKVMQTSIGQGETQITPLLNCMIAASVANHGVMMKPYLVDSILDAEDNLIRTTEPVEWKTVMSGKEASTLEKLMRKVVTDGTGSAASGSGYTAYGKTGSAEVTKSRETDAWFIGYAVSEDTGKKVAVSIVVEGGGAGGSVAAPMAREIFREAFDE